MILENLLKAIYSALANNSDLTELVPADRIRRGWNEPVGVPTIRFAGFGARAIGDDSDNSQILEETINVTILTDGDLEIEPITSAILNSMKAESVTDDDIEIHSLKLFGDSRGTFFDPIRKRHRKDLEFSIIYSLLA